MIKSCIARLNLNGSTDAHFDPEMGFDQGVRCVAKMANGSYVVGGDFTEFDGEPCAHLVVLSASGERSEADVQTENPVHLLLAQADQKVIVGEVPLVFNETAKGRIFRLREDLTVDLSFESEITPACYAGAIQIDGKVLVAGKELLETGMLARLYNDPAQSTLELLSATDVSWQRAGAVPVGRGVKFDLDSGSGYNAVSGVVNENHGGWHLKLETPLSGNGVLRGRAEHGDSHSQGIEEEVYEFSFVPKMRVTVNGAPMVNLATLNFGQRQLGSPVEDMVMDVVIANEGLSDLTLSPVADPGTDWDVLTQPDLTVPFRASTTLQVRFTPAVRGAKSSTLVITGNDGTLTLNLAGTALSGPGSRDESFQMTFSGNTTNAKEAPSVKCLAMGDGGLMVGGAFVTVNTATQRGFARFTETGGVLPHSGKGMIIGAQQLGVEAVVQLPNGKWMIGGRFTQINGVARSNIARLNADGTLDTTFKNIVVDGPVRALAVQADGGVLMGGDFQKVGGQTRKFIARFTPEGALDAQWPGTVISSGHYVQAIALLPDGKILIGGKFTSVGGKPRNCLARLDGRGEFDESFDATDAFGSGYSYYLKALNVDGEGRIYARYNGMLYCLEGNGDLREGYDPMASSCNSIVPQTDGKVLLAGGGNPLLVRLNADGSVDDSFVNTATAGTANTVMIAPNGQLYLGGDGMMVEGVRTHLVRVRNREGGASNELTAISERAIVWQRGGTSPEAQYTYFELSEDEGLTWTLLGQGVRQSGGWGLTNIHLPVKGMLRGRAYVSNGRSSGGFQDATHVFSKMPSPDLTVRNGSVQVAPKAEVRVPGKMVNQYSTLALTLQNSGTVNVENLTYTLLGEAGIFEIVSQDRTPITPYTERSLEIRFNPKKVQEYSASLEIKSNVPGAKSTYVIQLKGRGWAGPEVKSMVASTVTSTAVTLTSNVRPNHDETLAYFQYRQLPNGPWVKVPSTPFSIAGFALVPVKYDLDGLSPATTYEVQCVASNSVRPLANAVLSAKQSFTTLP